jgi:hypothetical protein
MKLNIKRICTLTCTCSYTYKYSSTCSNTFLCTCTTTLTRKCLSTCLSTTVEKQRPRIPQNSFRNTLDIRGILCLFRQKFGSKNFRQNSGPTEFRGHPFVRISRLLHNSGNISKNHKEVFSFACFPPVSYFMRSNEKND